MLDSISETDEKNATSNFDTIYNKFGKEYVKRMSLELYQDSKKEASQKNFELKQVLRQSYIDCKDQGAILLVNVLMLILKYNSCIPVVYNQTCSLAASFMRCALTQFDELNEVWKQYDDEINLGVRICG